uniref:hypothetical protein n=1 Tax=Roseobacter sp. HKCCD5988 TaxID=3120338 RepID=UPI0030EBB7F9
MSVLLQVRSGWLVEINLLSRQRHCTHCSAKAAPAKVLAAMVVAKMMRFMAWLRFVISTSRASQSYKVCLEMGLALLEMDLPFRGIAIGQYQVRALQSYE